MEAGQEYEDAGGFKRNQKCISHIQGVWPILRRPRTKNTFALCSHDNRWF